MTKDDIFVLILATLLTIILLNVILFIDNSVIMPQCHEDVVLVGTGDFEHGRWDSYICGPAVDDYLY